RTPSSYRQGMSQKTATALVAITAIMSSQITHSLDPVVLGGRSGDRLMCGAGWASLPELLAPRPATVVSLPSVVIRALGGGGLLCVLFAPPDGGEAAATPSRNCAMEYSGSNGPSFERAARTLLASPSSPSFNDRRIAPTFPFTVCATPSSSL